MWFILVVFFILNGILRNTVYAPHIGEWEGHVVSSVFGIGFIFTVTYLSLKHIITGYSGMDLVLIGLFWFSLTVVFEFGFGHYVVGHSWDRLLSDYNILEGRMWSLVLLTTISAPYIVGIFLEQ
ncbi:hypothetical protein AKJ52_02365 [candidate division MSBL1 archaeon SCGC-AAA382C18]|uniref:Uncharacterized protein n=1 Tax=candidate division MSBL1 archaeon SCGC-AAA382C18 TaxID=1698281 RepID=A0A133VIM2_9EURY|nr:hypothetical protein AKJ52_02365 [candidate division MSBL1 archaeon SCGC-AAA382C18]